MKKFLVAIFASLALVFAGVSTAPIASAAPSVEASVSSAGSFGAIQTSGVTISKPNVIGGGVIKPLWLYVSCYTAMNGERWCWRYGCTYFEYVALGCRDGWYRTSVTWRA